MKRRFLRLQLHGAIYRPDSFVLMLRYCANLKAIRYESTNSNRIVADKSHHVIVASAWFPLDRNAIVESYDSSMFCLTAKRLMRICGNTFFFHKLEPTWVRLMP